MIDIACIFFECQPQYLKNFLIVNNNNENRRAGFNRNKFGYTKDLRTFTTLIKSNYYYYFIISFFLKFKSTIILIHLYS